MASKKMIVNSFGFSACLQLFRWAAGLCTFLGKIIINDIPHTVLITVSFPNRLRACALLRSFELDVERWFCLVRLSKSGRMTLLFQKKCHSRCRYAGLVGAVI